MSSLSQGWREAGNSLFSQLCSGNALSPTEKRELLNKAWTNYHRAYDSAETSDDKASAAKNVAVVSLKIVKLDVRADMKRYYCKQAMKFFGKAFEMGKAKSDSWLSNILQSMYKCLQSALDCIHVSAYTDKLQLLEECAMLITDQSLQADCFLEMTQIIFAEGIASLQKHNFKKCLQCMHDCHRPMEEASRLGQANVKKEAGVLKRDVYMHLCVAESMQARYTADELLSSILQDEECLNIAMIWDIIDWYKKAIILTRENDVEMEAIALSRLGRVYDKVLKQRWKAKECFKRCIQLVSSLSPRTFYSEEWYKDCTTTLERYQQEVMMRDEALKQEKYAKIKEELKDELGELEKYKEKDSEDLLIFVYKNFPPKNSKHRIKQADVKAARDGKKSLKKLLQTAVTHYHPDRVDESKHGINWKVLCEEITKVLTERYERMKG